MEETRVSSSSARALLSVSVHPLSAQSHLGTESSVREAASIRLPEGMPVRHFFFKLLIDVDSASPGQEGLNCLRPEAE